MAQANERIKNQMIRYNSEDPLVKEKATEEIVDDYRKFITHIINKHFSTYIAKWYEDMFSVGVIGLLEALPKYDPEKSMPTTYFAHYIIHEIYAFVAEFIGKTTPHYLSKIAQINKATAELASEGNEHPNVLDIAMKSRIKPEIVMKVVGIQSATQSISFDSEESVYSGVSDPKEQPDSVMIEQEGLAHIKKGLDELPQNMRNIIVRRFGLDGFKPQSHEQISRETGIPASTIRRLFAKALELLRDGIIASFYSDEYVRHDRAKQEILALIPEDSAERMITTLLEIEGESIDEP